LPAALAVSADDDRWVLVNASCDISRALAAAPKLQPKSGRASPVAALLLTDANIDHAAGLLEFRQAEDFAVYSSALVRDTLCAAPMFAQFARGNRRWTSFDASNGRVCVQVAQAPRLEIAAIPVSGLLPTYAGGHERKGAAVAFLFEHAGARLIYAPIFLAVDGSLLHELEQADAVFLDGTCWSDEEMIQLGLGSRTSRAMGHAPISGSAGSLQFTRNLRIPHRYYTHVNNSNPILNPASAEHGMLQQAGFAVADDGLEISLDGSQPKT
jgi:pyrroloquinoline quinone biosynthesis protein B